jgi:Ni/Co efflux regulator RcnB
MRKALMGILVAATAATPIAADAQSRQRPFERAAERIEQRQQRQEARQEVRQNRQEARQERQAQPRPQPQQRQAPPPVAQQRPNGEQRQGGLSGWAIQRRQQANGGGDAAVAQRGENRQERWEGRQERREDRREDRQERREDRQERREDRQDGRYRSTVNDTWQGDRNDPRMERHRERYERLERQNQRNWQRDQREDRREARQDRRWNRDWRRDRRYDWQNWRYSNRHVYRQPAYYAPYRGHRYSRFSIGVMLGSPFYHQRYWIADPWQYRLPDPGYGYTWVRYYNDVLLVDTWSGEVVDVIYDFFW